MNVEARLADLESRVILLEREVNHLRARNKPKISDPAAIVARLKVRLPATFTAAQVLQDSDLVAMFSIKQPDAQKIGIRLAALYKHPPSGPYRLARSTEDDLGWHYYVVDIPDA